MEENKVFYKADYITKETDNSGELIDSYYFYATDNDEAYKESKEYEKQGIDYSDVGHKEIELTQIAIVDEETETLEEKEIIFY